MTSDKPDTGPPFGTVYFGGIAAVLGLVLTAAAPGAIGPLLAIAGTLFVCTGLVLRSMYRLTRATSDADPGRTQAAPHP